MKTIEEIGSVVITECEDIIHRSRNLNSHNFKFEEGVIASEDCRFFTNYVYFGALRGTKNFISVLVYLGEEA